MIETLAALGSMAAVSAIVIMLTHIIQRLTGQSWVVISDDALKFTSIAIIVLVLGTLAQA